MKVQRGKLWRSSEVVLFSDLGSTDTDFYTRLRWSVGGENNTQGTEDSFQCDAPQHAVHVLLTYSTCWHHHFPFFRIQLRVV